MKLNVYKCNLCRRVWNEDQVNGIKLDEDETISLVESPVDCDDHICLNCVHVIRQVADDVEVG